MQGPLSSHVTMVSGCEVVADPEVADTEVVADPEVDIPVLLVELCV